MLDASILLFTHDNQRRGAMRQREASASLNTCGTSNTFEAYDPIKMTKWIGCVVKHLWLSIWYGNKMVCLGRGMTKHNNTHTKCTFIVSYWTSTSRTERKKDSHAFVKCIMPYYSLGFVSLVHMCHLGLNEIRLMLHQMTKCIVYITTRNKSYWNHI
jgi:hypothetical protein